MSDDSFLDDIETIGETRNRELKRSMNWNDEHTKFKITESIMAMSNIRDGGMIIIGVEQDKNKKINPTGMSDSDYDSFNYDDVCDHVASYVDPHATFNLEKKEADKKKFIVISVNEFDQTPIICKKAYWVDGKCVLNEGIILIRTRNSKPQSSKIMSLTDMQDVIGLATDKGLKSFVEKATQAGLSLDTSRINDEAKFQKQISDFLMSEFDTIKDHINLNGN